MAAERELEYIFFRCIQVQQPIGAFYVGAMLFNQVTFISYADVRRIEDRDLEKYIGIQRPLDEKRVKELREYVLNVDSSFPTSVILSVRAEDALFDVESGIMRLRKDVDVARVIDGQHRIAGLLNYKGPTFQLNVTLFVDMDVEDQAHLFATINLKQTKVNKSLAYDLFEFARLPSPQKTCHNIAKLLDLREGSPFFRRIRILGTATGKGLETLSQALVVERILPYITTNPMRDRDMIRRGLELDRATRYQEAEQHLFFRNMFIDRRDEEIALVIWNFFTAAAMKWTTAWNTTEPGFILNRGAGFSAFIRALADLYVATDSIGSVPSVAFFRGYLDRIDLQDSDFHKERYIPGSGGESRLYKDLVSKLGIERQ